MAKLGDCFDQKCCAEDVVCCDICREGVLWERRGNVRVDGTLLVTNTGSSQNIRLVITRAGETFDFFVEPGECRALTMTDVKSITNATNNDENCEGKFEFAAHYKF